MISRAQSRAHPFGSGASFKRRTLPKKAPSLPSIGIGGTSLGSPAYIGAPVRGSFGAAASSASRAAEPGGPSHAESGPRRTGGSALGGGSTATPQWLQATSDRHRDRLRRPRPHTRDAGSSSRADAGPRRRGAGGDAGVSRAHRGGPLRSSSVSVIDPPDGAKRLLHANVAPLARGAPLRDHARTAASSSTPSLSRAPRAPMMIRGQDAIFAGSQPSPNVNLLQAQAHLHLLQQQKLYAEQVEHARRQAEEQRAVLAAIPKGRTTETAEERRARRAVGDPPRKSHTLPTKSSRLHLDPTVARRDAASAARRDAAAAAPDAGRDDADASPSRGAPGSYAIITPDDLPDDDTMSDSGRSECDSPFYGLEGALSPW